MVSFDFGSLAPILGDLAISAVGALIAFSLWYRYRSPVLTFIGVQNKQVFFESHPPGSVTRVGVENVGPVPARNCTASIWLKGRNQETGDLYAASLALPWADNQASLIANESTNYRETETIGPSKISFLEVNRQTHTGRFDLANWVTSGDSGVYVFADEVGQDLMSRIGEDLLLQRGMRNSAETYRTNSALDLEVFRKMEWEEAKLWVFGENSNVAGRDFSFEIDGDQILLKLDPLPPWSQFWISIRRVLPKI